MTEANLLLWLEKWYFQQCDPNWDKNRWENIHGIHITTIDNPGWLVKIDLADTSLDGRIMKEVKSETNDDNWLVCKTEDNKFIGHGGPSNLYQIISEFKSFATKD